MTDYAEGSETGDEPTPIGDFGIGASIARAQASDAIHEMARRASQENTRDAVRREHLDHARRVILGAPCASWMQEGRTDEAA